METDHLQETQVDAQVIRRPPNEEGHLTPDATRRTHASYELPYVALSAEDSRYKMDRVPRGIALILNHMEFNPNLNLMARTGTTLDANNLVETLKKVGYEVTLQNDLTVADVKNAIADLARTDHSEYDSVIVAVLSHGESGVLFAKDGRYKPQELWEPFTANKCHSLVGKPKLFFIQACQGDQVDPSSQVSAFSKLSPDKVEVYKIPVHADFLIAYSSIPGYFSWRYTSKGSWFIDSLCRVLNAHSTKKDLLSMMADVCRLVAFHFDKNVSNKPQPFRKKQTPCITTTLTREVYFTSKELA